jgi:hypothetical protein
MGKLKDLAIEYANRKKGPQCSVARLLDALPIQDRAEVVEAMESQVPSSALSEALLELHKVRVNAHIIARHRRRECMCPS